MQHEAATRRWIAILWIGIGAIAVLGFLGYRTHTTVEEYVASGSLIFEGTGEPYDFNTAAESICGLPMARWKLRSVMADPARSPSEAIAAAIFLGIGAGAYVDALKELTTVRTGRERSFAYEELIRLGHHEFMEPMLAGLDDTDPWVRGAAAHWACEHASSIPLEPALEVLRRHTDDADPRFRETVGLAIERLERRLPRETE